MKKVNKTIHTPNTQKGMGDFTGTAVKNPMGKMKEGAGLYPVSKKGMKKPPKSLA